MACLLNSQGEVEKLKKEMANLQLQHLQEIQNLKQELDDKHRQDLESTKSDYKSKTASLERTIIDMKNAPVIVPYTNNGEFITYVKGLLNLFETKMTKTISTWHQNIVN